MSEEKVVALPGLQVPVEIRPIDPELIETIEEFLEAARSGEVVALGYVTLTRTNAVTTGWCGPGDHNLMCAGIAQLEHRYHFQGLTNKPP